VLTWNCGCEISQDSRRKKTITYALVRQGRKRKGVGSNLLTKKELTSKDTALTGEKDYHVLEEEAEWWRQNA